MKMVEINSGVHGSTGAIMLSIAELMRVYGNEVYTFSAVKTNVALNGHTFFGTRIENMFHRTISVFSGISGIGSKVGTRDLLHRLDAIQPDIIHLHNLHGWYINLPMLFEYIKRKHIKIVWTLHDCWAFTAQCSHFTIEKCEKWKTGCYDCPRYKIYPYTFVDKTDKMWYLKQEWFSDVENMRIVTPSQWLATLVKQSFLGKYPVQVINNGISLDVFHPIDNDFRRQYGLEYKKILLGVASGWSNRKGLDVFIQLAKILPEEYRIVLVGVDADIEKLLPHSIIPIRRTQNQKELAEIYSAADVFVNPTREENFPTVNIEALACGTPVVTFDTGGSGEIPDYSSGAVVPYGSIMDMKSQIIRICTEESISQESCIQRAHLFDASSKYREYLNLFNELMQEGDK